MNRIGSELHRVCDETVTRFGLCGATVTVMTAALEDELGATSRVGEDGEALAAASDDLSRTMAERQFDLGEGPSREAFGSGRLVVVKDLHVSGARWPAWTPLALAAGIEGIYAVPLSVGAARLGVFTCYLGKHDPAESPPLKQLFAAADEIVQLLLSPRADGHGQLSDREGQRELYIRTEVYQAQGMLMVAHGIGLNDALARLRGMAYAEDVELNELAIDLVSGRRRLPEK